MILSKTYESLEETLLMLKQQVNDSLPYARSAVPKCSSPESLFDWLKERTTYVSDPKGIELLQSMETLLSGARMGVPGGGDCDCFTIASLAALQANGFSPTYVILVGRNTGTPVHIYAGVYDGDEIVPFDLTNEFYGEERTNYKYRQILPFSL